MLVEDTKSPPKPWQLLKNSTDMQWALIWFLLCLPWLSGVKAVPFDAVNQFFPAVGFVAEQLRHLQAPWWNPYLFGGYPQFADPQMMTFQPTMVVPMLLAPQSLHWFNVVVALHLLVGGLGALRVARHYRLQAPAQLLFTLVLLFSSVAASRLQHTPMVVSYCMLPWLWLGLSRLRESGQWRDVLLAGIAGGLCALQLTQVTYLIVIGCAVYALLAVMLAGTARWRLLLQFFLVGLLAALLSAPQWLSTLAYLPLTNRAGVTLDAAIWNSVRWQSLATLLSGNVFSQARGESWAFSDITTDYLYYGAVPLVLWLGWGGAVVRREPWRARAALLVLVLAVVFALGGTTPIFPWLHTWLPGLNLFRRPSDGLYLAIPAVAWLSAQAFQCALHRSPLRPHWPSLLVVMLLAAMTVWLVLAEHHLVAFAWLAASTTLGAAAVWQLRQPTPRAGMVIALVVTDMLLFNVAANFNTGSSSRPVLDADRGGAAQRVYRLLVAERRPGIPTRAMVFGNPAFTNGAALHALPLVNGYNPLLAADYQQMVGMPEYPDGRVQDVPPTAWAKDMSAPLYDLLGLRWVVAEQEFPGGVAQDAGQTYAMRREGELPRVLNPREVRRYSGDHPPAAEFNATTFTQTVWLQDDAHAGCADSSAGAAQVTEQAYLASSVALQVVAQAPAWVVINELYAPGWEAETGGQALPLLRANGLFRAVCVPAGAHVLTLRYRPMALWRWRLAALAWSSS